ncbi:interleukin-12 subunit beta-like [Melozone crissalis]|uniref:interleukin-12 subunit beta-like n=1 Tax=Melozone crissalis TaxID=40204 RepID=UPI0023DA8DA1|nr:interleukin-12 subunit beta-like [Melozone crissalis]
MLALLGLLLFLVPAQALTAFPPKFQVGKLSQDVVVRCDTDTSEQHISWTLNGDEEPMAELVPEGQKLTILGLDLPATGNYSCWAGPVLLDSTYVVLSNNREEEINVSCQAESYNGSFHCSWPGPTSAIFRARLIRSDGSVGPWVPVAGEQGRFNASLADPLFCPFGEELRPLQLHLEGLSDTSYLNLSRHFFLRDIVRPEPPQKLMLQQRGEQLHLAWAPPASWPLPKSYFALLYHLQYELHNGTQVEQFVEGAEEAPVPAGAGRVRISCRDPYTPPAWSPWSAWMGLGALQ